MGDIGWLRTVAQRLDQAKKMTTSNIEERFHQKCTELKTSGDLASAIERDDQGNWVGIILVKNYEYSDLEDQIHWAKSVKY